MIDLYGVLQEQETINGELGLGVDYYKGEKGDTPIKGVDYLTPDDVKEISDKVLEKVEAGTKGEDGKSAYQIALDEGFEGSETEWLASLKGADGRNGIDGINGTNGKDGTNGINGKTPVKGVDYFTQAEIQQIENNAAAKVDLSDYTKSADLSTVATSGSYNDLSDKPSIPSTTGLATETYVDDKIAEIDIPTVPTKVSAFTNDAGYLTEHQSLIEYAKKTDIPAPYTLPTASTSTLGGVKVDGNTITIADGVISAKGGSGSTELDAYIKDASVNGNTLTLTKKDDTQVVFTPSGGSGGGNELQRIFPTSIDRGNIVPQNSAYIGKIVYDQGTDNQYLVLKDQKFAEVKATKNISPTSLLNSQSEFNKNKDWVLQWVKNNSYNVCVDGSPVFLMNSYGNMVYYYWMSDKNTITQGYIQFKDTTLNELANYNDQQSYPSVSTTLITEANWQNYITAGGGSDWQTTTYIGESNLYNAKEMIIYWEYNTEYRMNYYNFTYNSNLASYANQTFNVKYDYSNGNSSWYYDGNQINTNNMNIQVIYYKT